jgi:hypothetical protein
MVAPDHETVDRLKEAPLVVEEVRGQPAAVALDRFRRGVRQEPRRASGTRTLDDGRDT